MPDGTPDDELEPTPRVPESGSETAGSENVSSGAQPMEEDVSSSASEAVEDVPEVDSEVLSSSELDSTETPGEDPDDESIATLVSEVLVEVDSEEDDADADLFRDDGVEVTGGASDDIPPEVYSVSMPVFGKVSFGTFAVCVLLAMIVFGGALALSLRLWSERRVQEVVGAPVASVPVESEGVTETERGTQEETGAQQAVADDSLTYEDLMDRAERKTVAGDLRAAAALYESAYGRRDAGVNKVLFARHKLSQVLARMGRWTEAVRICESLRSVGRPGDELWKHSLITSVTALSDAGQWPEFWRHLYLLRANSARYSDELVLNRWIAYMRAMAKTREFVGRYEGSDEIYGITPPPYGKASCGCRPLMLDDIVVTAGKYGDGTLELRYDRGELHLRSEGALLKNVLAEIAAATGLVVRYSGTDDHPVVVSLGAMAPQLGIEMILGSVGMQASPEGSRYQVQPLDPSAIPDDEALKAAIWSLQEFMILYPESQQLPEAYYATAHVFTTQRRDREAVDQWEVLCEEFPQSNWALYARYILGRRRFDEGDWLRGERDLLLVVDTPGEHPLRESAYFWAAQCQVELEKYDAAVVSFRKALAGHSDSPMAPRVMFNIAYCMERAGAPALEVEERYLEVRTRYPETPYARRADYRSARMSLNAAQYETAVRRYEFYLSSWPMEGQECEDACRDLIRAYIQSGDRVKAVLLGEIMRSSFGHSERYWQALPALLEAYEDSGLREVGLAVLEHAMKAAEQTRRRDPLLAEKARFLVDLKRYPDAEEFIATALVQVEDEEVANLLKLQSARIKIAQGDEADAGLALCRRVALATKSDEIRASALRMEGRYYEENRSFDLAVRSFTGQVLASAEETSP